ncbi:uncharacterized protein LOC119772267 isoform X1 [Cyprinodon tularosa]|uniref:uncharacterized protein LOC119772267 isoform X1 n=1 Tax=Cyprinodon tularosa TaxID=77115 RepID=UPI0018E20224|nr:uncharacterized protein LOC119772267 isoform X1 [Cyprinodon tularosa]
MDHSDVVYLVVWLNIRLCLPITVLVIALCCMVRLENNPFINYLNLLVSNLIQFGCMIIWMARKDELSILSLTLYYCSVMASLGFRICIILERYAVLFPAQLQGIRQPKSSVLISFIVWGICLAPVAFLYDYVLSIFVFVVFVLAILSIPIMVFCLARTLSSLPVAASVPTEEKRRVVGVLVLLFISYTEMIVSTDVWSVLMNRRF